MNLRGRDCCPFDPPPTAEEVAWLRALQQATSARRHTIPLGGRRTEEEPIVYCERDGSWWAGRYVGSMTFGGHRLTIEPRFGINTLRQWLFAVSNVPLVPSPGTLREDVSFIVQLLAAVWARSLADAARHGLPALRREARTTGLLVRGRVDMPRTLAQRARGSHAVCSVRQERSADHAASRAIVAAFQVLRRWLGPRTEEWLPERVRDLLIQLQSLTGSRPPVPTELELQAVRYTPITRGFRSTAALSRKIALSRGLFMDTAMEGESQGVLLDVAELWELYVLAVLRRSAGEIKVIHGTHDPGPSTWLLNHPSGGGLGVLRPDAILRQGGRVRGIADAKYKRLQPRPDAPDGVLREDLYQLSAYLTRFGGEAPAFAGLLAYPEEPSAAQAARAESGSPWYLTPHCPVWLLTLPHDPAEAVRKLERSFFFAEHWHSPVQRRNTGDEGRRVTAHEAAA